MVNEMALRDALMALTNNCKTNYVMLSSVLAEIAAVRETVRGLDPTFDDVLARKQKEVMESQAVTVRTVIAAYDVLLQRLSGGEVC